MNQRTVSIVAIVLGVLLLISLGLLVLFGVRLADANGVKTKEIQANLLAQEKSLESDFQAELEKIVSNYTADEVFGSFKFSYPKVWSTYVHQEVGSSVEFTFLADPNLIIFNKLVPGPYTSLRVLVYGDKYDNKVKETRSRYITGSRAPFKEEDITVSEVKGKKFTGTSTESKKKISFVLLPMRDKTLYIGTDDSDKYSKNLDTIVKSFKVSK